MIELNHMICCQCSMVF